MTLYERMQAKQAEQAMNKAMQEFQRRCPVVNKNAIAGKNTYADLTHIVDTVKPLLAELGLSYRFNTDHGDKQISVICVICHTSGASFSSSISVTIDRAMKAANVSQQDASAVTYGKRYSFCNALGIVTADIDDDAVSAARNPGEAPEAQPNAPEAKPRGRRVNIDDVKAMHVKWMAIVQDQSKEAFRKWVFNTCGVPQDKTEQVAAWGVEQLRTCLDAIEVSSPPSAKEPGDDEIPY